MPIQPPPVAQTLRIFVGSPGGVDSERAAARAIIGDLNPALQPFGWQIIPLGWEQRGPAAGRAQADINPDVRACDVFLGVLWNRWGTPTGDYQSGFEEEWAIALERHQSSGSPDLWLYFKQPRGSASEDGEQVRRVLTFRKEVEDGELAFHKPYEDVKDFTSLVRQRLLVKIMERSGLTRTDIGAIAVDWAAAYEHEPVDLVPGGRNRRELVDDLEESDPKDAARLAMGLADDVEQHGFGPTADGLRERACRIWLKAGEGDAAVALMRRALAAHVWELRLKEADRLLDSMREQLPPELATELRTWRACVDAPEEPAESAAIIEEGLGAQHAFVLDLETAALWRAVRWRALIDADAPGVVIADETVIQPKRSATDLELALLRADALRATDDGRAPEAWQQLRLLAVGVAVERPERAAWIATRVALDGVKREDLPAAEMAYADAATRWTNVSGASANAAHAFFSAQAAMQLRRDWTFSGWSWRPIAAQQQAGPTGLLARAEELEREALYKRLDEKADAKSVLHAAIWCYSRAGFLDGLLRCHALLADAYAAEGDEASAVALHCEIGQGRAAESLAQKARDGREVVDRMAQRFPSWSEEARLSVLKRIGRHSSQGSAETLVREALTVLARGKQREFDNAPTDAAEALAELAAAIEDSALLSEVTKQLEQIARAQRYSEAQAGRLGLRYLHDVRRIDAADVLVAHFARDDRPDEPSPTWVAEHLGSPERLEVVRSAALRGGMRPLAALIEAGVPQRDDQIRALCNRATRNFLASDIGMTPDGEGMWGLMALDLQGRIASATGDDDLRRAAGERLLVYAADSRWPMGNRTSAVRGLYALAKEDAEADWLDRLRPIASPEYDLDEESGRHMREMFAERGDLEAIALTVCALISTAQPPSWLDESVREARVDARVPLRTSAWLAAQAQKRWFDVASARYAVRDDSSGVRAAALNAWRKHDGPLPQRELQRLTADASTSVRLALIPLLAKAPNQQAAQAIRDDPDAYVRGIARTQLAV